MRYLGAIVDKSLKPSRQRAKAAAAANAVLGMIRRTFLCTDKELILQLYTVSQKKTVQISFCQNFVKFPPILIIFGRKMAKRLKLCEVHSFFISTNLHHHTTVLNADVPN